MNQSCLSPSEVRQVLSVLKELGPDLGDPRRHRRRKVGAPVWVSCLPSDGSRKARLCKAMARDVSEHGAGLEMRRSFEAGSHLVMPLAFADGTGRLVLCRVAACHPAGESRYLVGVEFVAAIDDAGGGARIPDAWFSRTA